MNWDTKRKVVYALAFTVAVSAALVFSLRNVLFPEPTCFDKKANGYELDVDCGGVCSLRCSQEVNPLSVIWSKAVPSGNGLYDLVAMVANTNIDNASKEVGVMFSLYDENGTVTSTFSGSTTMPLDGKFPLIVQNVPLVKAPTSVLATLADGSHFKVTESPTSPTVKILDRHYEAGSIPRVYATIMNTKHREINNLPVRVLLFDEDDNVYAVGQTVVPVLPKEGVRDIVFTWNTAFKKAPTKIGLYPIFNPFEAIEY